MMTLTQELVVLTNVVSTSITYEDFTTSSTILNEKPEKLNGLNFNRW